MAEAPVRVRARAAVQCRPSGAALRGAGTVQWEVHWAPGARSTRPCGHPRRVSPRQSLSGHAAGMGQVTGTIMGCALPLGLAARL